jgi:protease-4
VITAILSENGNTNLTMKNFFVYMLATVAGIIVASILLFLLTMGILSAIIASQDKAVEIDDHTVLQLTFDRPVHDRKSSLPVLVYNITSFRTNSQIGLNDVLENLRKAAKDEHISGIFLDLSGLDAGIATVEEIRNALLEFKKTGKFIIAYSSSYSQKAYYLASAGDKIYMNPGGSLDFIGLSAEVMFYKKTLEKLDVKPEIIRHGRFKSAVEPFMLDKMSPENREQIRTYVGSIWDHMVKQIAATRGIGADTINKFADSLMLWNNDNAISYGLIDTLLYRDQVLDTLARLSGVGDARKLDFVTHQSYLHTPKPKSQGYTRNKIAVIYAEGDIVTGDPGEGSIGSESLSRTIRQARQDSSIKAIVFRVNSGGGSALASEVIWRELYLAQKVKPVIASMGDVAASGGYYVLTAADTVVAGPTTITGSIGVFGLLVDASDFFQNKLGITTDTENTNAYSDFGSIYRPLSATERNTLQKMIDETYHTFVTRVSDGRELPYNTVDQMAEGRVWSGNNAFDRKLVDVLGGLNDAVELAAGKAKLDNYRLVELPRQEDAFTQLMKEFSEDISAKIMHRELGNTYLYFRHLERLIGGDRIQARIPFDITVD